jgi:hypothetical protein
MNGLVTWMEIQALFETRWFSVSWHRNSSRREKF